MRPSRKLSRLCKWLFIRTLLLCALSPIFTRTAAAQDQEVSNAAKTNQQNERQRILQRERWFAAGRNVPGENSALLQLRAKQQAMQMRKARLAAEQASQFSSGIQADFSSQNSAASPGSGWVPLGPAPLASDASGMGIENYGAVSGRATSIAIDPADAGGNTVYIGGAYGGVWKSQNAANADPSQVTWASLTDNLHDASPTGCVPSSSPVAPTLAVGAIAIQPGNTNTAASVILVGTGEPDNSIDSYYGVGILRFTNGGANWCLISQAATGQSFAGLGFSSIVFSTANPNLVVAAAAATSQGLVEGLENPPSVNRGIYYSHDAGQTWNYATIEDGTTVIAPESVTSIVYNEGMAEFVAAIRNHGFYASPDGVTWTRLAAQPGVGLSAASCPSSPTSDGCPIYRAEITSVPARKEMYAWFISLDSAGDQTDEGIWQTLDGGNTWTELNENGITNCGDLEGCGVGDGAYNLALTAVPDGAATDLYAGAVNLYKCEINSAQPSCSGTIVNQFLNLTHAFGCAPDLGSIAQVHPDQHAIAFALTNGHSLMYFANDGGIYRALDGFTDLVNGSCGTSNQFDNLNSNLGSLTQFVSFSEHPSDLNTLLGGTQGNGSPATSSSQTSTAWLSVNGGDGGYNAINPSNTTEWFTENTDVSVQRCTNGIACHSGDFVPVVEPATVSGDHGAFYTPYILDPQSPASELIVGTCRVWRGAGTGSTFTALSNSFETGAGGCTGDEVNMVRSLAAGGPTGTGSLSQIIYTGTNGDGPEQTSSVQSGRVWVTTNAVGGPATWADVTNGINPDQYPVASLALDSSDTTGHTVYAAIMGFHVSHVWKTTSAGASWIDFTGTSGSSLPDSPANTLVVDPQSGTVYVGTDVGVFASSTSNPAWTEVGPTTAPGLLPNVAVTALQIYNAAGVKRLRASTYGRGIWEISLISGPDFALGFPAASQTIFPGQSATFSGTASAFNGYSSSVALGCIAGATPPPQTCNPNPLSVVPTIAGANISVTASDAVGDYSFSLHGSGTDANATTHDASLTLHVVDFTLGPPSSNSISVPRGTTSSNLSFVVNGLASFSGTVNLACSGLPAGATCTFAPSSSVTPTSTAPVNASVTITVPASSAIGSSTITISATSSGAPAAKTQSFTLNVVADPDFVLSAGTAFPTVKSGGSSSGTINVASQDGFAGIVTLTCLVSGGTGSCSASPNALNSYPATSTITVNATDMASGSASLTVTGTSGTTTHSLAMPFQVSDYQLAATSATASAGQTATSTLTITPLNSYSGSIALSCDTTAIPGAACTFNPASPVTVGGSPVPVGASISIPSNIQNKTYSITVNTQDADGAPQHSTTIPVTVGGDFEIIPIPLEESLTIQAGQPAPFNFNVTPMNGAFNNSISFSCSGLPAASSCSFSPASATPGNTTDSITMNVATTGPSAALHSPFRVRPAIVYGFFLPIGGLFLWINSGLLWDESRRKSRLRALMVLMLLIVWLPFASCGGGGLVGNNTVSTHPGTLSGTYTITITATSNSLTRTAPVTLIVQ